MDCKWEEFTLSELCHLITDGKHGDCENQENSGFYFLSVKDVFGNQLNYEKARQITESDFLETHKRTKLEPGDVLFTNTGTIGRMAIAPEDSKTYRTTFQKSVAILKPNRDLIIPRFLYYLLSFDKARLSNFAEGTTQKNLLLKDFRNFPVHIPPLSMQQDIVNILGTLDDKIELNQQMNRTLEGIARTLFKSWFIDFDPVRAKLDGRQPAGMDAETAALFPDSFEDSPFGKIPKGWKFKPVEELVEGVYDGPHATPKPSETGPVFLGIKNFTGTSLDLANIRHINEEDWPRWTKRVTPQTNDIVFTYEATLGYFALIPDWLRCCLGRRIALIRPKASDSNAHFLFHTFSGSFFQEFLNSRINHGSTVDRILLTEFPSYPVLWPGDALIATFEDLAGKHWRLIHNNQKQNQGLIAVRDALLPKLLSGEIHVKDTEQVLETVA